MSEEIIIDNFNKMLNDKKRGLKKLEEATTEAIHITNNYHARKNRTWLQTDFKKLGLTNDKQRTAYVEENCKNLKVNMEKANARVDMIRRKLHCIDQHIAVQTIIVEKEL